MVSEGFCGANPNVSNGSYPYLTGQGQVAYGTTQHNGNFETTAPNAYFTTAPGNTLYSRFYGPDALLAVAIWQGVCGVDTTTVATTNAGAGAGSVTISQNSVPYQQPIPPVVTPITPTPPSPDTAFGSMVQEGDQWLVTGNAAKYIDAQPGIGYSTNIFDMPYVQANAAPNTPGIFAATWATWGIENSYFQGPDGNTISNNESLAYSHLYLTQAYQALFFADVNYSATPPTAVQGYNEFLFSTPAVEVLV